MMQAKLYRCFIDIAAALLTAMAVALILSNLASGTLMQPHDPILMISMRTFFWILGAGALGVALTCIFAENSRLKLALVLWFALNLVVYEFGFYWSGAHGARGYLGTLADTFGLSTGMADTILKVLFLYLLTGSFALLVWSWRQKPVTSERTLPKNIASADESELLKMTCVLCHGHIQFSAKNLDQKIPCPHCRETITLKRQANIKTSCVACDGHIEFPIDALGQTIACPHCKTSITLQRPQNTK
jgi:hypothetical protein